MNTEPLPESVWLYYGKEPDVAADAVAEKSQQIYQRVLSDEEYLRLVDARTGDLVRIESGDFEQKRDTWICIKLFRTIHINWQDGEVRVAYGLSNKGNGPELTLMKFEIPSIAQGKGLATRMFTAQVEAARIFGFDQIDAYADYKKGRNGYYTWPRLGFDKQLTPEEKKKLPDKFSYYSRLSELVDDPEGRTWWRNNGAKLKFDMQVTFDTTPRSHSMQRLQEALDVLNQKGEYWDGGTDTALHIERGTSLRPRRDWQGRTWKYRKQ